VQVVVNEEVDPSLVIKRLKQEIRDLKDEVMAQPQHILHIHDDVIHIKLSIGPNEHEVYTAGSVS